MTSTREPATTRTLTARCAEDLLAMAPALMGFWPEDDIVMLTFGADRPFHGRTDLPPHAEQSRHVLAELDERLLGPARQHGVRAVVLLYYGDDITAIRPVHQTLRRGCRRAGIEIVTALQVDGARFREIGGGTGIGPLGFVDYDVSCHPFVVDALVTGRLAHATRADLAASVQPDPDAVARCAAVLARQEWTAGDPADPGWLRSEGTWVRDQVGACVAGGTLPDPVDLARLVSAMRSVRIRDAAWSLIGPGTARAHVAFWTALVRQVPDHCLPAPATMLGWAAWQAGDGALAWVAVDRCAAVDPHYSLAGLLASMLQQAVPPEFWEPGFDWTLGLP